MPKINVVAGPTDQRSEDVQEVLDARADEHRKEIEKEDEKWDGNSSSTSDDSPETSGKQSKTSPQSPARSTANPSEKDQKDSLIVPPGTTAGKAKK